jgi:geranylgeranyl diphosphate synthase, type II
MYNTEEILAKLNDAIAGLEYPSQPEGLYEPIQYALSAGGKRIRPVFMLLTAQSLGTDLDKIMPAAVGLEMYHNYTLLHDDLMDKALVRRGKPTVHRKWNSNTAILSGDSMLVLACKLIYSTSLPNVREAMGVFLNTALEIGEGQQYDMNFETRTDVSQAEYIEMIRLKTSVLIGCALKMGAVLSSTAPEVADRLYAFGEQIGLAFQLQDDLLDVYGDPKVFGKRIGGDILCDKKTFLLINAWQKANARQRETLNHWVNRKEFDETEKISAVTSVYNELGIKEYTIESINGYFDKARAILDGIDLPQQSKQPLWDFATQLVNRNY